MGGGGQNRAGSPKDGEGDRKWGEDPKVVGGALKMGGVPRMRGAPKDGEGDPKLGGGGKNRREGLKMGRGT